MKKICVVDRIEDGIITLVPDDGSEIIELKAEKYPHLKTGDAVVKTRCRVRYATPEEHPDKTEDNKERLEKLFGE